MSCGELFVNLGGGSTPPNGMLQTANALSGSLQVVKDNLGNSSTLSLTISSASNPSLTNSGTIIAGNGTGTLLSSLGQSGGGYGAVGSNYYVKSSGYYRIIADSAQILQWNAAGNFDFKFASNAAADSFITWTNYFGRNSNGYYFTNGSTATQNGAMTILGSGGNILSLRDSSNVEKGYFTNIGSFVFNDFTIGSGTISGGGSLYFVSGGNGCRIYPGSLGSGSIYFTDTSGNGVIQLGDSSVSGVSLKRSSNTLQTKLGNDSDFAVHEVLSILTQKPTNSNAKKIKFGDKSPITDGALVALGFDAQWEVDINGTSYWFAGKTSAFA